jgi:anti-sigma factor ChrR (cupin superfamily)
MNEPERIVLHALFDGFRPERYGEFVPFLPGVEILPLYGFSASGKALDSSQPSAAFLRYAPGASVPAHRHLAYEHIFVLEGSQTDGRGTYAKGSCLISAPGTQHNVSSPEGCLVLAIWNKSVEVIDEQSSKG